MDAPLWEGGAPKGAGGERDPRYTAEEPKKEKRLAIHLAMAKIAERAAERIREREEPR